MRAPIPEVGALPPTALMLIAYSTSLRISYGDNWDELVHQQVPGYQSFNGCPKYTFQHEFKDYFKLADEALYDFWTKIYKHMHAAVPEASKFIDRYYQDLQLPSHIMEERGRYLWFTIEQKTASEILEMVKTYPSYKNYLSYYNIEEGEKDDPMVYLSEILLQFGAETQFDLICPFFSVVATRKTEEQTQ